MVARSMGHGDPLCSVSCHVIFGFARVVISIATSPNRMQYHCTHFWFSSQLSLLSYVSVVAVVAAPAVVAAAGFTGAGIAAGSLGAKMMSAAALANGGGVAAGGVVATLQCIGAAGLSTAGTAVVGGVGAVAGRAAKAVFVGSGNKP
ncbi:uncharacterized protein LOC144695915 [Cetorhinus maximus]